MNNEDTPLWNAIKRLDQAKRKRVSEEASKMVNELGLSPGESVDEYVNRLMPETK